MIKSEDTQLEGPGQFLRHYSPNIESYLFKGEMLTNFSECVLIDFGGNLK